MRDISPHRVVFLGVEGVICTNSEGLLEVDKVRQLVRIVSETGARVCISSQWRLNDHLRTFLYERLAAAGIEVIGTTPDAREEESDICVRAREICGWLKCWHQRFSQRIERFVAIDDRDLLQELGGDALRGHSVQTNPMLGLTEEAASRAIELLLPPYQPSVTDAEFADRRASPKSITVYAFERAKSETGARSEPCFPRGPRPAQREIEIDSEVDAAATPQEQWPPPTGFSPILLRELCARLLHLREEPALPQAAQQAAQVEQRVGPAPKPACARHGAPLNGDAPGSFAGLSA